ncbi:hypothetical protein T12_16180 [Trichinella patagoniensis]|uniref:Uncharacterized protein n=2 Tax=Trichinella TaxID=6333 RepID=A0A0V0ZEC3_9BILA|nr:hypothetical protein T12_16180 [Trichinella patagoniensis]
MDRFVDRRFDESFETFQHLETNVSGAGQRFEIFHFKKRLASHRRTHIPDVDIATTEKKFAYFTIKIPQTVNISIRSRSVSVGVELVVAVELRSPMTARSAFRITVDPIQTRFNGSRPARGRTASTLASAWALHSARVAAARLVEARSSSSVVAGAGSISTSTDVGLAGGARQMASSGRRMATIGAGGATIGPGEATIGPGEATIGAGGATIGAGGATIGAGGATIGAGAATIGPGEATIGACFSNASVDVAQFIDWNPRVTAVFQRSGCDTVATASATHPTTPALVVVVGGLLASTTGAPRAGVVIVQPRSEMRLGFVGSFGLVAIDDRLLVSLGGSVENVCIPASVASASATVASTTMPHFVEIILATAIHRSQMLLELIKPLMTIN